MNALWLPVLLASAPAPPDAAPQIAVPGISRDALLILLVCSGLGVLLLLLVFWWWQGRRRHRRHHHHHRHRSGASAAPAAATEGGDAAAETGELATAHHHRRRRRRSHRGRNPTLAETGGLPPPRPEGQAPPGL
jgi:hypothetical protein